MLPVEVVDVLESIPIVGSKPVDFTLSVSLEILGVPGTDFVSVSLGILGVLGTDFVLVLDGLVGDLDDKVLVERFDLAPGLGEDMNDLIVLVSLLLAILGAVDLVLFSGGKATGFVGSLSNVAA